MFKFVKIWRLGYEDISYDDAEMKYYWAVEDAKKSKTPYYCLFSEKDSYNFKLLIVNDVIVIAIRKKIDAFGQGQLSRIYKNVKKGTSLYDQLMIGAKEI